MKEILAIVEDSSLKRQLLDTLMPGGKNWGHYIKSQSGMCKSECPGYSRCDGSGPDGLICSDRWQSSKVTSLNLSILKHVLNNYSHYDKKDFSHPLKQKIVEELLKDLNCFSANYRMVSPEELQRRLKYQTNIGEIGEEIALAYEKKRLIDLGAINSEMVLDQVSLKNAAAGFDIRSRYKGKIRYIEVKSSTSIDGTIYVSSNEISTLKKHGNSAFLYIVHITSVEERQGTVVQEIRNPFKKGKGTWIEPILFSGKPPRKKLETYR